MKTKIQLTILLAIFGLSMKAQSTVDTCRMKIGMNFHYLAAYVPEQPFVDLMKTCNEWKADPTPGATASIPLDADGYPLQLPYTVAGTPQIVYTLMNVTQNFGVGGTYPAGTYTVLYTGKGKLRFGYDATVTAQSAGVITFTVNPTNAGIIMFIDSSDVTNHIRNIRVLMPGTQTNYLSQPFQQTFLNKIAPFTTLRFMNWEQIGDCPNIQWNNRASKSYYTQSTKKGCAYEYIIKLCNLTKKDMWIGVPHMADSTYIANMAKLVMDSLNPQLKIYLEYSNEVWNSAPGFTQYNWINANGPFFPVSDSSHWKNTAYWAGRVFRIWTNVFGTQTNSRLVRVAACFNDNPDVARYMMKYFKTYNWTYGNANCKVDAIAPAPYFGLDSTIVVAPINAMGASATPTYVIQRTRIHFDTIKTYIRAHDVIAKQNNVKLLFYEGGQHLVTSAYTDTLAHQAVYNAQIDTGMYSLYRDFLNFLHYSTKADLLMNYLLASQRKNTGGSWGVLESVYQDTAVTKAPKYKALINYINKCQAPVGINEITKNSDAIKIFPNPSAGIFSVVLENNIPAKPEIEIYNVVGEKVSHQFLFSEKTEINLSREAKGMYFYKVLSEGKFISGGKLIVQ